MIYFDKEYILNCIIYIIFFYLLRYFNKIHGYCRLKLRFYIELVK